MLLIVAGRPEQPLRRQRADAGQMLVELGGEEAGPPHLPIRDDVDARLLLIADREVDRVVEHLGEVGRPELAALGGGDPAREPAGMRMRPDDARQEFLVTHPSTSANENARAGLSTKNPRRIWASRPRVSISAANSRSRYPRPGEPPNARR